MTIALEDPKPERKKSRQDQIQLGIGGGEGPTTIESAETADSQANPGDPVPALASPPLP